MKKIVNREAGSARTTMDPCFDILNTFFRSTAIDRKTPEITTEVNAAIDAWIEADCDHCDECLLGKPQTWLVGLNLSGVTTLCSFIEKLHNEKIKPIVLRDIMERGIRMPGSGFSR